MKARFRFLVAAAPVLAVAALALGSRCTDSAHSLFRHLGMVHGDAGCASGMALGPSTAQLAGLTTIILISALGSSAFVREIVYALVDRLAPHFRILRLPAPAPVTADYARRLTWGASTGASSRDPPRC